MLEPTSIAEVATKAVDGALRIYSLFDMGKSLIEIYKDKNNTLKKLFIKAFAQAVNNVSERYDNDSIKSFLENCRKIDNVYCCKDLYDYLCKKNNDREVSLSNNVIVNISNEITEQLNCIVLNDNEYKDLYNVFSYYQLNSISFKLDKLDNIMQEFIKLIDDHNELRCDNELFARAYKERLFMHAVGDISISLSDIFVMPNVKFQYNGAENALKAVRDFVNNRYQHVFFLEGFGGYGKSSIVSYLAYNYLFNRPSPSIDFLDDRQLVIIRLRDIDSNNIIKGIKDKLNNDSKLSSNAVLIFDGLDELCLIENKSDGNNISESIISEFLKYNRKIIITSRPTYVRYDELKFAPNIKYSSRELVAFDVYKRERFVDLFTFKDNNHALAAEYIKNLNVDDDFNSIYGSPFLLYLIMSGGIEEDEKDNSWKLLHRIFHEEMFKPMYNPGVRQLSKNNIDRIYQYNCDISYEMFKTQNKKLSFTYDELGHLLPEYSHEEYVKKSHGLFSYMRYNNGAVEFVHNHIRDFFLCEKVLRKMLEWYENDYSAEKIALELCTLLKYGYFEKQTKVFIKEALLMNDYKVIKEKCTQEHLPSIFNLFHNSGGMINYSYFEEIKRQTNVCFSILSRYVIDNSSYIYKNIYLNKKSEYIEWFSKSITNSDILPMMSLNFSRANLKFMDLSNINFKRADLNGANLYGANLRGTNLYGTNLYEAVLHKADLAGANLHGADLRGADLTETNLHKIKICDDINLLIKYNKETKFPNDFIPDKSYWACIE